MKMVGAEVQSEDSQESEARVDDLWKMLGGIVNENDEVSRRVLKRIPE